MSLSLNRGYRLAIVEGAYKNSASLALVQMWYRHLLLGLSLLFARFREKWRFSHGAKSDENGASLSALPFPSLI